MTQLMSSSTGKNSSAGPSHYEGKRIFRSGRGEAAKGFVAALVGEEEFPANAMVTVEDGGRRRSDFEAIAVAADEGAAADVSLDQAFGFEFSVGVGDGGAMNAQHRRELTAGGDAVARAQVTGVDEGAKLIAKLNVERNVGLWLEMHWEHCLSP